MGMLEVVLIGVGLSMDAFAVTVSNSMCCKDLNKKNAMSMPLMFGLFQGLMPVLGYFLGSLFATFIDRYAGIITLLVLGFIGGNMVRESFGEEEECKLKTLSLPTLLLQAVATSIDAFAVGVSFCALKAPIFSSAGIIAVTTFVCSTIAVIVGKKCGEFLGKRAELCGGLILIFIGIKAILPW
ncbi:MAG: manganese efflux pump MntP family protein [Massiliimalia sp.]|jgi:putative Mn2+ efflux pump MntP